MALAADRSRLLEHQQALARVQPGPAPVAGGHPDEPAAVRPATRAHPAGLARVEYGYWRRTGTSVGTSICFSDDAACDCASWRQASQGKSAGRLIGRSSRIH